jgi:5'-3' exonuclease
MRLIIDGNSWMNQALLRGVDHDEGRVIQVDGKPVQVNGAQYGIDGFFEKFSDHLKEFDLAPRQAILVWDGRNAKLRRRSFLPTYKVGRDKCDAVSEQLNIARERATQMMRDLGVHIAQQEGLEADDVIGYLCKNLRNEKNVVATVDGDLSVLVDENTSVWRLGELNKNPFGGFPHKYITLYKALVGDPGDKIPGAKGFGDTKFVDLVRIFGLDGLDMLTDLIQNDQLDRLKEDIADFPHLQKLIDDKQGVATSWRVASLLINEVNTKKRPLELIPGMVKQWSELADEQRVPELRRFYGTKTLVTAANYDKAYGQVKAQMSLSPFAALDIETSSSEESDEWISRLKSLTENDRARIDVLGHELTGMSLTFGDNSQHTIYMPVDHKDTDNITVDQCRQMAELIPQKIHTVIQNRQFEFSVLYRTWGGKWADNGWHGMVPNAVDTKIGASYTNENYPKGLKDRSLRHLDYAQATYEQTTCKEGPVGSLKGGEVLKTFEKEIVAAVWGPSPARDGEEAEDVLLVAPVVQEWERRQYKMNELTGREVFDYGCDDTICTAALHTHYRLVMELEQTWGVYLEVEQLPEYLTSLAYVQGIPVSLENLRNMEARDEVAYEAAWATLKTYLLGHGWTGTVCPEFTEMSPAAVKEAAAMLVDTDEVQFTTKKRKLDGMAFDLCEQFPDSDMATILARVIEDGNVHALNKLMKDNFTGDPKINFGSPKQMQNLFYHVIKIKPRIFNKLTDKQREIEVFRNAFKKMRREKDGKEVEFSAEEMEALISKASTDDTAVEWALKKDNVTDEQRAVLKAYQTVRTVMTRRNLFYRPYKALPHWRDGYIHPSLNQCQAVTLRYSASDPNIQQMPKLGEGVEFRGVVQPHMADALVGSLDFSGQELRDMAEWSGDEALTACYVGDNLKDPHSLTAVAASLLLWGEAIEYDPFIAMLKGSDPVKAKKAKDLRGDAKTVNFASQYDAMAPKIAEELLSDEETAQAFLDAKDLAMPGIMIWKDNVRSQVERDGYATTRMGARRHLRETLMSDNRWEASKAGRQGPNFKIQGSGAEQTKLAMASMWRSGVFTGRFRARFYAPVHDEVVFSVHRDDAYEVIKIVHGCMTQPYGGKVIPIISSISLGRDFHQQIECGETVDSEVIAAAVSKAFEV